MKLVMTPENANHQGYIETDFGRILLYLFKHDFPIRQGPSGKFDLPCPWHLIGMGTFHESPEAALAFMKSRKESKHVDSTGCYTGYGFNTHAPCGN